MHLIRKELLTKYSNMVDWTYELQNTWVQLQMAVDAHDIDKAFTAVKRLLFIRKKMTIKA